MSLPQDVYTPWRDPPAALTERHVGREAELEALLGSIRSFARGGQPLPIYLHGPRGCGKSHLLALGRNEAVEMLQESGIQVRVVSEDIPALDKAEDLATRIMDSDIPPWMRVDAVPIRPASPSRTVVFLEGLHKHLDRMKEPEQRAFRGWLAERPWIWLAATGVLRPAAFDREAAFFGVFDPFPLLPLEDDEAEDLLDRLVPQELHQVAHWQRRRRALIALSGGSPRTLVALGKACVEEPTALASDHLHAVVRSFTAHYQMRFSDLAPQEQQVVERLTQMPRELSPTELGAALQRSSSHISQVARRLENAGVLLSRKEGRSTWYRLSEPLFRHWYEYRTAPWEDTRVGFAGRLLEAILSPDELVEAWWQNPDSEVRGAAAEAISRHDNAMFDAVGRIREELGYANKPEDQDRRRSLIERADELNLHSFAVATLASHVHLWHWDIADSIRPLLTQTSLFSVEAAWDFCRDIKDHKLSPRKAFQRLIPKLSATAQREEFHSYTWSHALEIVLRTLKVVDPRGKPWLLKGSERDRLASLPWFRSAFLLRGKQPTHPPLLQPADLLGVGLGATPRDGNELIVAAASRRASALFEVTVHTLTKADARLSAIPLAPDPWVSCPSVPNTLLDLFLSASGIQPGSAWYVDELLSWAASYADLDTDHWHALLTRLDVVGTSFTDPLPSAAVDSALVALGSTNPQRLDELSDVFPGGSPLKLATRRARAMAAQLAERRVSHLHPELELVWQELGLDDGELNP